MVRLQMIQPSLAACYLGESSEAMVRRQMIQSSPGTVSCLLAGGSSEAMVRRQMIQPSPGTVSCLLAGGRSVAMPDD